MNRTSLLRRQRVFFAFSLSSLAMACSQPKPSLESPSALRAIAPPSLVEVQLKDERDWDLMDAQFAVMGGRLLARRSFWSLYRFPDGADAEDRVQLALSVDDVAFAAPFVVKPEASAAAVALAPAERR